VVLSHIGKNHWWMKDMPTPDWINFGGKFVPTQHHRVAVQDRTPRRRTPQLHRRLVRRTMPDMNQTNPLVANYLIQNNIWWIEYAGLSGLRIDTYGYSDGAFLTAVHATPDGRISAPEHGGRRMERAAGRGRALAARQGQPTATRQLAAEPDGLPDGGSDAHGALGPTRKNRASTTSTRRCRSTTCIRSRATWSSSAATTTWRACSASSAKTSTATR
jgi:hypothetical protein